MADNVTLPASGTGDNQPKVAADEVSYSGDTTKVQLVRLVFVSGAEGSKSLAEISDAANGVDVDVTRLPAASSASLSNVAAATSSTQLAASNASRKGLAIFNDSTAILYVKFGTSASATSFTVRIPAGGYWEMPLPIYTGAVNGIWSAAAGDARVTEL